MMQLEEKIGKWIKKLLFITVTVQGKPDVNRAYSILMDDKTKAIAEKYHQEEK